jgi:hypothetical protein
MVSGVSYNKGKTWNALKKAWKAYKIARSNKDVEKMKKYEEVIRALQRELGLEESKFSES